VLPSYQSALLDGEPRRNDGAPGYPAEKLNLELAADPVPDQLELADVPSLLENRKDLPREV